MNRYIVTKTLKVLDLQGNLVYALDAKGNKIPLAGYWQGPGKRSVLSRRYRTAPPFHKPTSTQTGRAQKRAVVREMRKLQKKMAKPQAIAARRRKAQLQARSAA